MKCCFCKKDAGKYGNNALPIMDGRCCDECNDGIVIPIRILRITKSPLLKIKNGTNNYRTKTKH